MKYTRMYTLTTPIQKSSIDPSEHNHTRNKRHPNQKGRRKPSLFTGNTILYTGNPKDFIGKLLELMN